MIHQIGIDQKDKWALSEFGEVDFGDERLKDRLIKMASQLSSSPESSINQACGDWANAKAAYRFFQNENIVEREILRVHVKKTVERMKPYKTILAIQDTCYISYKNHKKTEGLGIIASRIRSKTTNFKTPGLVMHTSFGITTEGLPLGILDQKIHSRPVLEESTKQMKNRSHNIKLPVQDKESIRWLDSLKNSTDALMETGVQLVTVCDREADMYDLFEYSEKIQSPVLIRARQDRQINKPSPYSKKVKDRLWKTIQESPVQGTIPVEIPPRDTKPGRTATLDLHFNSFIMNPSKNNARRKTEDLPDLKLYAVYVIEKNPPKEESPLEWMLLTNLPIIDYGDAVEKVSWYCLRWRIEVFHKILKSGLYVEKCRLGHAERLIRYLTVMSIIAWKLFFMTLLARANPSLPCTVFLEEKEWKVLYTKIHKIPLNPQSPPPSAQEAVLWISQLGGFLARKGDKDPGPIVLWRGWKRLVDLSEGWSLAYSTCG